MAEQDEALDAASDLNSAVARVLDEYLHYKEDPEGRDLGEVRELLGSVKRYIRHFEEEADL